MCGQTLQYYLTLIIKFLKEMFFMPKATGIVRRVDSLGRIVLPIELRRIMNIKIKDSLEIYVDDNNIILKKYEPACIFCGEVNNVVSLNNKNVCPNCVNELHKLANK